MTATTKFMLPMNSLLKKDSNATQNMIFEILVDNISRVCRSYPLFVAAMVMEDMQA